jgi:hypothetical protein
MGAVHRRRFLRLAGGTALMGLMPPAVAACFRRDTPIEIPSAFRGMEEASGSPLQVFQGALEFLPGENRIPLALIDESNAAVLGARGNLWAAESSEILGPFPLDYHTFASPEHVHDPDDPKVFATDGFYLGLADLPEPGFYQIMVGASHRGVEHSGFAAIEVLSDTPSPTPGEPAVSLATPTFSDPQGVEAVCTRQPPCPLHQVSLRDALESGPVVLVVATPALCTSRVCGPVVDEVMDSAERWKDQVAFVHAEVFQDLDGGRYAPVMEQWRLESEPWVFVIDGSSVVRERFEGPVTSNFLNDAIHEVMT